MINNPTDSVCDYLAELLYEETPETQNSASVERLAVATVPVAEKALNRIPSRTVAKVERPEFVEAPAFDKEKLAKLLSSTPLKVQTEAAPLPSVKRKLEPQRVSPVPVVAETESVAEPDIAEEPKPLEEIAWCENGRPSWAQERFDVLLFKVHGLTLAVPLIALGQIQPITDELTPIFGQAKWFMGLQPTPMGQIKTVNTAMFVMPERYDPAFLESAKYVVSIDGLHWGLAVDSVQQPKTLEPEDVKWRQGRGLRPWLAGTVKAHMCALIDVPNMGVILAASDRNSKKAKK